MNGDPAATAGEQAYIGLLALLGVVGARSPTGSCAPVPRPGDGMAGVVIATCLLAGASSSRGPGAPGTERPPNPAG